MLDNMFQGRDAREKDFFMHIIRVARFFSNELIKRDKGILRTGKMELELFISTLNKNREPVTNLLDHFTTFKM